MSVHNTISILSLPKILSTIGFHKEMLSEHMTNSNSEEHEKEHISSDESNSQSTFSENIINNGSSSSVITQEHQVSAAESPLNMSQDLQETAKILNKDRKDLNISVHPDEHSFNDSLLTHLMNLTKNKENQNAGQNEHDWLTSHLGNSDHSKNQSNLALEIIQSNGKNAKHIKKNLKSKFMNLDQIIINLHEE